MESENILINSNNNKYYNKEFNKNNINKKNQTKNRNPGVDIIRAIGMYIIILNHFLFYGKGYTKFSKYKNQIEVLHILTDWHNNGFALLSGIVGYKTHKYSNLLYLWLTVFFYSTGIYLYIKYFKKSFILSNGISMELFPIIFKRYWYFTSYFGMYLFLPIISKGISSLTKYQLKFVIISFIAVFVFLRDIMNPGKDVFNIGAGYTMIWLIILFITGSYIGKYKIDYLGCEKKNSHCFIYAFL